MSICSDVTITRDKAKEYAKLKLMLAHEKLVDKVVSAMDDDELEWELNEHSDLHWYSIEGDKK